jgi:hypothetical protein
MNSIRQWVFAPEFDSEDVEALRQTVDGLASGRRLKTGWQWRAKSGSAHCD